MRSLRLEPGALRRENFAVGKLDLCLERLREPLFAEHLWTDHVPVPRVAEQIAGSAGLGLLPSGRPGWRNRLTQAWIGARSIRVN